MIKAIDTVYNGHRFRSRLEARWAVFFDTLNIKWNYEPEGYEFDNGIKYLPDFWLSELKCFIEIKPFDANEDEVEKAVLLASESGHIVLIFDQGLMSVEMLDFPYDYNKEYSKYFCGQGGDMNYLFCECPHCGKIGIEFDGRADRINCDCPRSSHGDKGYNSNSERIRIAFHKARTARFEFGETNK